MGYIFFSPIAWDNMEGAHRPVRIASELARRRRRALYVQLEKSRVKPHSENLRVMDFEELGLGEQLVLAAYYGLDYGAMDAARVVLGKTLDGWETRDEAKVAVFSAPFRPFLEFLPTLRDRGYLIVFDVLDDYAAMRTMGYYCYDAESERFLAQACDLALPLSPDLEIKMQAYGAPRVCMLKDGVDLEIFREPSTTQVSVERGEITLGFWGWIWQYNVDVPLLSHLARTHSNWQIHLLGPFEQAVASALNFANVHFHGQVARRQLRAYADQFDVGILPAPDDAFNRARDPLKVYEYLACGKPVVATNQPQLAAVPGVYLSHDADEFIANVERAAGASLDHARLSEFLARQTWATRVDALLQALEETPRQPRPAGPPPHGAMPGAENDRERWQAYAQHLERLIADREAHIVDLERALAHSGLRARLKRSLRR
jgi:glycosyltransferase involved in cell wall biosynthesis